MPPLELPWICEVHAAAAAHQPRCPSHSPFRCVTPASVKLDDERKYSNVDLFIVAFKYYLKQQHCAESSIFRLFGLLKKLNVDSEVVIKTNYFNMLRV